jgi:5-deoxy-glucuronate isomerase
VTEDAYSGAHILFMHRELASGMSDTFAAPASDEQVLVLLSGDIECLGRRAVRHDVFDTRASAVYLPPGRSAEVHAHAPTELAQVTTRHCDLPQLPNAEPCFVAPDDVVVHRRGEPGWQRDVHDVIADTVPAQRLLVGETFNEPGQWSSFPPHKHDGADGEPALEEVYYFRFDRPEGFGLQGLYEANGDERAIFLRHGAIVGIPRGYHPVCAAPGSRLYYLWALAGSPRRLATYEDPPHRRLHDVT